jgi:hypothetical protein
LFEHSENCLYCMDMRSVNLMRIQQRGAVIYASWEAGRIEMNASHPKP